MRKKLSFLFRRLGYVAFLMILFSALFVIVGCSDDTKVKTKIYTFSCSGDDDMIACKGIPYAKPPVGDLRFESPQGVTIADIADDNRVIDATQFGNACPQAATTFGNTASVTEDCLYLNVYKPKASGTYPVMVWIHGGALILGQSDEAGYQMPALVKEGVIVVTINYRLGALGFLSHDALGSDSGNFGLKDQVQALKWVRANIKYFGGDPANVTIFGQSAGGHSVLSLISSPKAKGLFHKAIVESGAYNPTQMTTAAARTYVWNGVVETLCPAATYTTDAAIKSCLRGKTVAEILTAQGSVWPLPTTGAAFLPDSIEVALAAGDFNKVPVMIGSTRNEGTLFTALDIVGRWSYQNLGYPGGGSYYNTEAEYRGGGTGTEAYGVPSLLISDARVAGTLYTGVADLYLNDYAAESNHRFRRAISDLGTDWRFACNSARLTNYLADNSGQVVYGYWFTDATSALLPGTPGGTSLTTTIAGILFAFGGVTYAFTDPFSMQATHANEIPYIFGKVEERGGTAAQIALAGAMTKYWAQFAKTGDPNYTGSVNWDTFSTNEFIMEFAAEGPAASSATAFTTAHKCDCWNGIWDNGNMASCGAAD